MNPLNPLPKVSLQCILNFGSYFWSFLILAPLALAIKFGHWISAELLLRINCHKSSICCQLINLFVWTNNNVPWNEWMLVLAINCAPFTIFFIVVNKVMPHQNYTWKPNCKSEYEWIYSYLPKNPQKYHISNSHQKYSNNKKCCSLNNGHKIQCFFYEK